MTKSPCTQIREAQLAQYNYILVLGEKEQAADTVNVRTRDNHVHGEHALSHVIEIMSKERDTRSLQGLFGGDAAAGGGADGGAGKAAADGGADGGASKAAKPAAKVSAQEA